MADAETRFALLTVAIDRFGMCGVDSVSTREIAALAQTPMSSITYHFGSKERLYLAAAQHIADILGPQVHFAIRGDQESLLTTSDDARLELRRLVSTLLRVMLDERYASFSRFVAREQAGPTEAFEILFSNIMNPVLGRLQDLLMIVSDHGLSAQEARVRSVALLGQVLIFRMGHAAALRAAAWQRLDDGALGVIEHVALAHLDAITESLGKDRRPATDRPFGRQAAR
ncbi:DUF1956 domain-containing protein [Sphingomonas koreensis]|jgi:AcrR family transcriptional regulator|uniref:CerR family C-terminal domain-containing protein n=1 Tax=Sphingomonas TaxID=13687 RepID=UPI00083090F4|nr:MULTISPECIES: CerR family C-terminal domain-containing protein [Sphingomonas]PJI89249.1 TetR family transcriptional regulator [Sphingomonas koreensis]RSU59746.1 DUF1956 domain-containing protein [Sphingomonas koreensis]RSU70859.1 DUF1956 domain-containing protein [Sphingomonas koreensis]RSV13272.1 DUF1956 domain-containing protein [Sphingomonas sp. ABOLF]